MEVGPISACFRNINMPFYWAIHLCWYFVFSFPKFSPFLSHETFFSLLSFTPYVAPIFLLNHTALFLQQSATLPILTTKKYYWHWILPFKLKLSFPLISSSYFFPYSFILANAASIILSIFQYSIVPSLSPLSPNQPYPLFCEPNPCDPKQIHHACG